ncbi:MAG: hypothetical protein ABW065_02430 [Solirubrobacterales bacterium]
MCTAEQAIEMLSQTSQGMRDDRLKTPVELPPDGTLLRIGTWRTKVMWTAAVVIGMIALSVLIQAIQISSPGAFVAALAAVFSVGVFVRMPLSGVQFEQKGVKARTAWRTYRWLWSEIECFELREKGQRPRFQICLRDGRTKGFVGFFTQSQAEEERAQALFEAAESRLKTEHAKRSQA